jgi:hypothetical protein
MTLGSIPSTAEREREKEYKREWGEGRARERRGSRENEVQNSLITSL